MLDLLIKRRSIRKYKDQEVEKEKLDKILSGALTSPSARNIQPWELIVVNDKKILEKLGASRASASKPLANAPLAIVVIANPELTDVWIEDSSVISVIIQLISHSLGLASCWIQARERFTPDKESVSDYVKNILNIPENYLVESMIAIGYPDEEKDHHKLGINLDKVHFNKY